ncbi:unnamed protein product [Tetraodon nigroviridis]|uniref:(spotted green pufferfish) hypothetical protein n=1 Tax=Tetraodon nigroviridis TaxID=99883 RepID=Q4S0B5_TETNG|nr:unnamed protein product [Tetraodon nigroviridis]
MVTTGERRWGNWPGGQADAVITGHSWISPLPFSECDTRPSTKAPRHHTIHVNEMPAAECRCGGARLPHCIGATERNQNIPSLPVLSLFDNSLSSPSLQGSNTPNLLNNEEPPISYIARLH